MADAEPLRRTSLARILVIDDDAAIIGMLSEYLTQNGYEMLSALNGGDGLMLLEIEPPDLVLLDIRMPGLGGLEVLRRIRMVRPDLPVIIISGLGDADAARQTLRRGAVDYLPKPFDLDHVLRAIAAALGRDWSHDSRSGERTNTA
jgi:two-component system response regulator (stage 0 sporulation protein F)